MGKRLSQLTKVKCRQSLQVLQWRDLLSLRQWSKN